MMNLLAILLPFFLITFTKSCELGEFQEGVTCKKCSEAITGCLQCSSSKNCTKCAGNGDYLYLLDEDAELGYEKCVSDCKGKDRFVVNTTENIVCKICSKLPGAENCIECTNETSCTKCKSNQFLPRYLERSEDKKSNYCVLNCSAAALLVVNNTDGTGFCEFCSNLIDPNCAKCSRHLNESFSPYFYKCIECKNNNKLTYTKRTVQTRTSSSQLTYQVNCTTCNITDNKYYVSGDECLPCEKTWANCERCISNENNTQCITCTDKNYFNMDTIIEKRSCIDCTAAGSSKVINNQTGAPECYSCQYCVDCEDGTMKCRECEEGLRIMLPDRLICGICNKNTHKKIAIDGKDNYCSESLKIPFKTNVTYEASKWKVNIALYCSHPSRVYYIAGVYDDYFKKVSVQSIKATLKNKNIYINDTRDPYYRIYGFADADSMLSPNNDSLITTTMYSATLSIDKYLKANSKYAIVHFCENEYGIVSDLNMSLAGFWDVQDNLSRDIRIGFWLNSLPTLRNKLDLACAVSETLGGAGYDKKVISEVGLSCFESRLELTNNAGSRLRNRILQEDSVNISTIGENYTMIFIEKDYYMRDDASDFRKLLSNIKSDIFNEDLKKKALAYAITIQKTDIEVKSSAFIPSLRQYPLVFVSMNNSITTQDLNLNIKSEDDEGFFFVEFKLFYSDAIIYTALGDQGLDEPAPSIAQFLKGLDYKNKPLRNFTWFRAPMNSINRFIYQGLKQGKSYQFFIAQGDEYPAPHQAISDVQKFNIVIPQELAVVELVETDTKQQRDIGLGVGLGLGLPILGCVILASIKVMQKLKKIQKERERGKTTNPVMPSEAKELQILESENNMADSKKT